MLLCLIKSIVLYDVHVQCGQMCNYYRPVQRDHLSNVTLNVQMRNMESLTSDYHPAIYY